VASHIPCVDHERWFAFGWRLSYPLYDFTTSHFHLRLQGKQAQGKSTASAVLGCSLYGDDALNKSTVASLYSDASINPLIIEDNLETQNFYGGDEGRPDFYLSAATGGAKQKRDGKPGSGMITERIRALVMTNGIESIAKSEQTSRMMIIECDREKYGSNYTSAVLHEIKRNRNRLLSANFVLAQRVLKRIEAGDWMKVQERIQREYPDHPKNRMIEHLSVVFLFLEEYFKAAEKEEDLWDLLDKWMKSQADSATAEIVESDPIIQALDIIRESAWKEDALNPLLEESKEKLRRMKVRKDELLAKVTSVRLKEFLIEGTAKDLFSSFSSSFEVHARSKFPIRNSLNLVKRMDAVKREMEDQGYMVTEAMDLHQKQKRYVIHWQAVERKVAA
jgi:hypothetical protein